MVLLGRTKRLGFGDQCDIKEVEATEFVRKNTTMPIPKLVKLYRHGDEVDMVMKLAKGR